MNRKYLAATAALGLVIIAAYLNGVFSTTEEPVVEAPDEHAEHNDADQAAFAPAIPEAPGIGFLCGGELNVNVPGDEQVFPEAFAADFSAYREEGPKIYGLWPSPQWLPELEPPFWDVERIGDGGPLAITGVGLTDKTSLTSRITIDTDTGAYEIFWSVFPVGFTTPVELWSSAGQCQSFGIDDLTL